VSVQEVCAMATLATADLPSEDEEDDDYEPGADPEAANASSKRKGVLDGVEQARASKQAKRVDEVWAALRRSAGAAASTSGEDSTPGLGAACAQGTAELAVAKHRAVTAYQLCRPVKKKSMKDRSWMRQFGMSTELRQPLAADPPPDTAREQSEAAKAMAAAAMEAAKALATTDQYGRTIVTETRKFAGQNIQMKTAGVAGSGDVAQKTPTSGLDAMLAAIKGAKKVTVLDKSKADWSVHRQEADLDKDLADHNRSNDRYVDKQDFLARAEVREYEKARDQRLNADVRNRSRA